MIKNKSSQVAEAMRELKTRKKVSHPCPFMFRP